ncbi:hypothetical protein ACOMHN_050675 [Nucella lapillus]
MWKTPGANAPLMITNNIYESETPFMTPAARAAEDSFVYSDVKDALNLEAMGDPRTADGFRGDAIKVVLGISIRIVRIVRFGITRVVGIGITRIVGIGTITIVVIRIIRIVGIAIIRIVGIVIIRIVGIVTLTSVLVIRTAVPP